MGRVGPGRSWQCPMASHIHFTGQRPSNTWFQHNICSSFLLAMASYLIAQNTNVQNFWGPVLYGSLSNARSSTEGMRGQKEKDWEGMSKSNIINSNESSWTCDYARFPVSQKGLQYILWCLLCNMHKHWSVLNMVRAPSWWCETLKASLGSLCHHSPFSTIKLLFLFLFWDYPLFQELGS